jgi:hypothetical protein
LLCIGLRDNTLTISTAISAFLNGRAGNISIRTKYTAVSLFRFQNLFTFRAFPEKLAGICWHGFGGLISTFRAGYG